MRKIIVKAAARAKCDKNLFSLHQFPKQRNRSIDVACYEVLARPQIPQSLVVSRGSSKRNSPKALALERRPAAKPDKPDAGQTSSTSTRALYSAWFR